MSFGDDELAKYRQSDDPVVRAAETLHGTPYELMYVERPTASAQRWRFQHTTALSVREADLVIAAARQVLREGRGEWSSGERYVTPAWLIEKLAP